MKTKLFLSSILLLIGTTLTLLFSCSKKSYCGYDHTTDRFYQFNSDDKSKIPYTGKDTFQFKSDVGDIVKFFGQGKISDFEKRTSPIPMESCAGIPEFNYYYEKYYMEFIGANAGDQILGIKIYLPPNYGYAPEITGVSVFLNNQTLADNSIGYIDYKSKTPDDSIYINGVYQKGVFINTDSNKTVLYNFKLGILKFKDTNNKTWTRIN